jgi:low temperature requirement protein LtrA
MGTRPTVPELVDPPNLRSAQREPGLQRPLWTELFFDLVFVVAVGRTTDLLHEDPSPIGALWFGFIFVVLVWTWSNFVLYTERFETDDVVHRLAKAVAMFAVAACALLVPTVRESDANDFVVAYIAVRLVLIGLYLRAWRHVPEVHGALRIYLSGFTLGAACWAASLFVDNNVRVVLWIIGAVIELTTPLLGWRRFGDAAVVEEHLEERSGQFTLIVLGEVVTGAVAALTGVAWSATVWVVVIAASVIVLCVWWLTFDFVEAGVPSGMRALAYLYAHLPVYGAIAALGVGIDLAFEHSHQDPLADATRWIVAGATALYLAGAILVRASAQPDRPLVGVHLGAIGVVVLVAAFGSGWSAPVVVTALAAILLVVLVCKQVVHAKRARRDQAHAHLKS